MACIKWSSCAPDHKQSLIENDFTTATRCIEYDEHSIFAVCRVKHNVATYSTFYIYIVLCYSSLWRLKFNQLQQQYRSWGCKRMFCSHLQTVFSREWLVYAHGIQNGHLVRLVFVHMSSTFLSQRSFLASEFDSVPMVILPRQCLSCPIITSSDTIW